MEWANNGNLNEYLAINFKSLQWQEKIELAKGIAEGLKCRHDRQIFHRDLVSDGIFTISI
jgi:serine/threonine protein kinase